ncbi:hypothetical protein AQUCO_05300030v1 [Aquilegia coerulea]|uniref:Hyaluronan/mRNA-binding protein domain-containing protein n=1 Tax=Aquilegia coerulea TaxID=218851 RepID=A0A2G5CHZ9_AQUCA|nr:hypothetical protein AQUCO_05300030v1 [Aquilegia coerulea]
MASVNPFDLLGDDDNDDPSQLIAKKAALAPTSAPPQQQQQPKAQAKLPSKPVPPAQAVRETKSEGRGGGRGGRGNDGRGRGRNSSSGGRDGGYGGGRDGGYGGGREGGYGAGREGGYGGGREGGYGAGREGGYGGGRDGLVATEDGDVEKSSGRGGGSRGLYRGRRGGFNNGEVDGERPRRTHERRSGTGHGNELKREGSGRGNWGSANDEIAAETEEQAPGTEKSVTAEKQPGEEETADASKENPVNEPEEKEPEEKEMTLDEYTKILEEKRKALQALKVEERKVTVDKEFESMQLLSGKKTNDEIFVKLGSEKDKRKEIADKDEKAKKSVSINEFLKNAGGDKYYSPGGRGRGRGRGARGNGGYSGGSTNAPAPSIEDPKLFPNLKKT